MNYIRGAIDALKMDTKSKLIGLCVGLVVLMLKPLANVLSMTYFYSKFTWIVLLATIFFGVSLIVDLADKKYNEGKENKQKKQKRLQNQQRLEKYLLNLTSRKKAIILKMYHNRHHRDYASVNDSDVLDLLIHDVILPTNKKKLVDILGRDNEYNEVQELFLLSPRVVRMLDENKEYFN